MSRGALSPSGKAGVASAVVLAAFLASALAPPLPAQKSEEVHRLLRQIRDAVQELGKYPGEDFFRGEFFLGEGDDDTNKTHAVGVLVTDEAEGGRMTIVISRLEPAGTNPRVKYARDPRTIVCRFPAAGVEIVRSDYAPADLRQLLPSVSRAVVDKKNLLKLKK